jgi:hypothetical protein
MQLCRDTGLAELCNHGDPVTEAAFNTGATWVRQAGVYNCTKVGLDRSDYIILRLASYIRLGYVRIG